MRLSSYFTEYWLFPMNLQVKINFNDLRRNTFRKQTKRKGMYTWKALRPRRFRERARGQQWQLGGGGGSERVRGWGDGGERDLESIRWLSWSCLHSCGGESGGGEREGTRVWVLCHEWMCLYKHKLSAVCARSFWLDGISNYACEPFYLLALTSSL